jgi:hypothetical protein
MTTTPNVPLDFAATTYELTREINTASLTNAVWSNGLSSQKILLPKMGYYSDLILRFSATGGVAPNSGSVVFADDAPYNLVTNLLTTLQNNNISSSQVDSISGFGLYLLNLMSHSGSINLASLTTLDTTNGNFEFYLAVPRVFSYLSYMGVMGLNGSGGEPDVSLTIAGASEVYTTPPSTIPTLTVTGYYKYLPADRVLPPFYGSILQRTSETHTLGGSGAIELNTRGGLIKSYVFVFRDTAGNRIPSSEIPDPISINRGDSPMTKIHSVEAGALSEYYYDNSALPTGVVFSSFDVDPSGKRGRLGGTGQQWRRTNVEDLITFQGSISATTQLEVHTEMVSPALGKESLQSFFDMI